MIDIISRKQIVRTLLLTLISFLTISLFGQIRDRENIELTETLTQFRPGEKYTYLLTYPKQLGLVFNAEVFWAIGGIDQLNPFRSTNNSIISIERIEINFMSSIDERFVKVIL